MDGKHHATYLRLFAHSCCPPEDDIKSVTDRRHHLLSRIRLCMPARARLRPSRVSPPTHAKPACRPWPFSLTWTPPPDCSGKDVKPILHRKYNGSVIRFPDNPGLTLDPATSPELRTALGKDIVTASGTTLLGSDDKSGVALVMTLVKRLLREKSGSTG